MDRDEGLNKAKLLGQSLARLSNKVFPYDLHRLEKRGPVGPRLLEVEKRIHHSFSKQIKRLEKNRDYVMILHDLCTSLEGLILKLNGKYERVQELASGDDGQPQSYQLNLRESMEDASKIWMKVLGAERDALFKVANTTPSKNLKQILDILGKAMELEKGSRNLEQKLHKQNFSDDAMGALRHFLDSISDFKETLKTNLHEVNKELNILNVGEENLKAASSVVNPGKEFSSGLRLISE